MAVYTEITENELNKFLENYSIGNLISYSPIAEGVENTNYLIKTQKNKYILTLYENRVASNDLPFFMDLTSLLIHKGINCPKPIKNRVGSIINSLCNKPAAIISFLEGQSIKYPNPQHCKQLGNTLAKMHLAVKDSKLYRPNSVNIKEWGRLIHECKYELENIKPNLKEMLKQEIIFLEKNWPNDLEKGIIHADLFPNNVFFQNNNLSGIIDFYFACNDIFAYEIAICINSWCFTKDVIFIKENAQALLNGYNNVKKLTAGEIQALPILSRGSALRFIATRIYDWLNTPNDAIVTPLNPDEYIKKLIYHQNINSFNDYNVFIF